MCKSPLLLVIVAWLTGPAAAFAAASTSDVTVCGTAIAAVERSAHLPPQILNAIGIVESGRVDRRTGLIAPWPWAINVAGRGAMFDSAEQAIAAVQAAQAQGVQSIDVGCMQINLAYHPHAFASLQEAFDPAANVRYAASFLGRLHAQSADWGGAIAAYHSANPAFGPAYAQTVAAVWRLGPRYGLTAHGGGGAMSLEDEVDPGRVLTSEFRAQMVAALAFQRRHDGRIAPQQIVSMTPFGQAAPGPMPRRGRATSLADEVDPNHTLTPEFRAQMAAAAAFQRHVDAEFGRVDLSRRR